MKLKQLLLISACWATFNCCAQAPVGAGQNDNQKNRLIFAPLNFADVSNPSIQFGYERFFNQKYSAQVEFGVITRRSALGFMMVDLLGFSEAYYNTFSGYKTRLEFKRNYIKPNGIFRHSYVSAELFFNKNDGKVNASFEVADTTFQYRIPRPPGYNVYDDFFELKRRKIGLNFKYGVRLAQGKHFELEAYGGIGIAYRMATQSGRMNPDDPFFGEYFYYDTRHGNSIVISVPINVKCGWRF